MISFLGDVFLPQAYELDFELSGDFVFNMEYPITKHKLGYPNKVNLKAEENYIFETFRKNPLAVCISNNHILDYREEGYLDTINKLKENKIQFFGAAKLKELLNDILFIESEGVRLAMLAYTCKSTHGVFADEKNIGVLPIDIELIEKQIKQIKEDKRADRIIINLHWGEEEVAYPKPSDISIARAIIDAGGDLIIGHHAHCAQPYEIYKKKYIFYGLGNTIMPDLSVESRFNKEGESPSLYKKKQFFWNKNSLMITYDPLNENINISELYFNRNKLRIKKQKADKFLLKKGLFKSHSQKYHFYKTKGKLNKLIFNYISNPVIPKRRHFEYYFKQIFNVK